MDRAGPLLDQMPVRVLIIHNLVQSLFFDLLEPILVRKRL